MEIKDIENVVIVGSGPAGYTAALYTSRADLEPLVVEGFAWGGLLQQTTDVENYPGYPEGVLGPQMMQHFRDQAERFGTRFITDDATRVELRDEPAASTASTSATRRSARASVILAMGAEPKKLGVPGEDELAARGVSYCATCDAAFFRGADTIVVGGGDTAMEEATFLSKFAGKVTSCTGATSSARPRSWSTARKDTENIELLTPYVVERFEPRRERRAGEGGPARTRRTAPSARSRSPALHRDRPPAQLAARRRPARPGRRRLPPWSRARSTRTKLPGVFAAGDLTDPIYRQAVTAAGTGCMAALDAEAYLRDTPIDAEAHWAPAGGRGGGRIGRVVDSPGLTNRIWKNWAGDQRCAPERVERPASEDELARLDRRRAAREVAGAGHSFTDIACTDGLMLDLSRMNRVLRVDGNEVTVEAGITLRELGQALAARGLALENQGDVDAQTIAGAISTATHGTGGRFANISSQVTGVRIVTGRGDLVELRDGDDLLAARVSLGALGAISAVTLRCVPAFTIHRVDKPLPLDDVLARLDEHVDVERPLRALRVPLHPNGAHAHLAARRIASRDRAGRTQVLLRDVLLENAALEAASRAGRRFPALIPRVNRPLARAMSPHGAPRPRATACTPTAVRCGSPRWSTRSRVSGRRRRSSACWR